ncbi:MAG: TonB-dependent receptor [Verrucomicrobiota bacterium]|nr:TonB-dependent receptor [Verrucomicrobiota bacterium]
MNFPLSTLIAGAILLPAALLAQDAPTLLDPVIVSATLDATHLSDVPYSAAAISSRTILERSYPSLPDALRDTPGIYVPRTAPGQSSPVIRGFTGFRNLLLIDGIRLNNSVFREGANQYWATLDPWMIDRIEVVKSSSSVLFGSDAIGGTVTAFTKSAYAPDGTPERGFYNTGEIDYRWTSGDQSHVGHTEASLGQSGMWGMRFGFSPLSVSDIYAAGIGTQSHTGYDGLSFDAKLDLDLSPKARLTFAYQETDMNDIWRTHSTIYGVSYEGTTPGTDRERILDQRRQLAYAQLALTDPAGWLNSARLSFSWHRQAEWQDRLRDNRRRDLSEFTVDTFGVSFEGDTKHSPVGDLAFGASFYRDYVDSAAYSYNADGSFRGDSIQGPIGDDATYDQIAIFVQDKIALGRDVDFYLGARYTHTATEIGRYEDPDTGLPASYSNDWDSVVGNARLLWRTTGDERLHLYGGVAQGFRAPNLSDLSRLDSARSDERQIPALDLDPERYLTFEIGAHTQLGPVQASVSYYYTLIEDQITRVPTGAVLDGERIVTKRNSGEGYVQGIEAEASWTVARGWRLFGHLAWTDGELDQYPTSDQRIAREPISRLVPFLGQIGLRWKPIDELFVEVVGTGAARVDRLNSADRADTERFPPEGTPGWFTIDLRANWQARKNLHLTAALENLTNSEYRYHSSGANQPRTNVILGARVTF